MTTSSSISEKQARFIIVHFTHIFPMRQFGLESFSLVDMPKFFSKQFITLECSSSKKEKLPDRRCKAIVCGRDNPHLVNG